MPTILWERLGVTGTMVLLQRFKSKVYENGCNALTAACNASRSHTILAPPCASSWNKRETTRV